MTRSFPHDRSRRVPLDTHVSAPCPLCGHDQARLLIENNFNLTGMAERSFRVVECRQCEFRFLHPRPDVEELAAYYGDSYPAHVMVQGGTVDVEQQSLQRRHQRIAAQRIRLMRRYLPLPWDQKRVLDVGCGNGSFLMELARQYPVEAWGLNLADSVLEKIARAGPNLRLRRGDLSGADVPSDYFDVITMWHVLEHHGDPVQGLRLVKGWLRPSGLLMAEVPNAAGLIAWLCGSSWLGWDLPRHLAHFSTQTLRAAAEKAGLENVRVIRAYTLNPLSLSPLLVSWKLRHWQRKGRTRIRTPAYHRWDGWAGWFLRVVNGIEWLLGGNGLLLTARKESVSGASCSRSVQEEGLAG
ncbi:MAG: class I SAM-dependent methyltransferase [Gemmataceae bacterium]